MDCGTLRSRDGFLIIKCHGLRAISWKEGVESLADSGIVPLGVCPTGISGTWSGLRLNFHAGSLSANRAQNGGIDSFCH